MFLGCPHDPTAQGIQKECPCKRMPMFFNIHTAAAYGDLEGVRNNLIKKPDRINSCDEYGYTPLHLASQGNYADIVNLLLSYGALVDGLPSSKCTPLHRATSKEAFECCQLLIEKGADIERVDMSFGDMRTPLLKACSIGNLKLVQLFIGHGAAVDVVDAKQMGVLDLSQSFKHVIDYLLLNQPSLDPILSPNSSVEALPNKDFFLETLSKATTIFTDENAGLDDFKEEIIANSEIGQPIHSFNTNDNKDDSDTTNAIASTIPTTTTTTTVPVSSAKQDSITFGLKCGRCGSNMITATRLSCCGVLVCKACRDLARRRGGCMTCNG